MNLTGLACVGIVSHIRATDEEQIRATDEEHDEDCLEKGVSVD